MNQDLIKILLVENNPGDASQIQDSLKKRQNLNFEVTQVDRLQDACSRLDNYTFDIILLDLALPDSQGLDSLTSISSKANHLPIVVLTGFHDTKMALQAVRLGAQDYLKKDLVTTGDFLADSLCSAIERQRLKEQLRQQKVQLELTNAELKKRTEQLEILNQELEAFSYSVSHDLRSPLLTIDGFLFFLENQCGLTLNTQGKYYLQRIRQAVSRMDKLISSLLTLAQVQNIEICFTEVNLSQMVEAIAGELQQKNPQRKVKFKITPHIMVQGHRDLLHIALENLLSNAWKYTAQIEVAFIQFGVLSKNNFSINSQLDSIPETDTPIYFIQDNGVGFDMGQVYKLFQPFQRLESSAEFKGTGIGLATVQRIIRRHQGKIWATSTLGAGSTFYFTLS